MALNNVNFVLGQGGLGRPLAGQDHFSGILVYNNTLPSGFSSSDRIKKFLSIEDAISAGIDIDYSDETPATGAVTFTAIGADGDTINIKITDTSGIVDLGTYTKVTADSSVTLLAVSVKGMINAGTNVHGYSATNLAGVLTIIAKDGQGIFLNTGTPLARTIVGTMTATLTQFTGGVASIRAIYYYHILEFFRAQPGGVLYFGIYAVTTPPTFVEMTTIQTFSQGTIRQFGTFLTVAFASSHITAIQAVCDANAALHQPISSVLYVADLSGTADITTLADRSNDAAKNVTALISQDGAAVGYELWRTTGKSIGVLGAALGAEAFAAVNEDIAWVAKFNMSNGTELDTLAFANGQAYIAISSAGLDLLNLYRYVFLRKFVGVTGSYFNDSHTCILPSSDYAYIENNRTIDKAIRALYTSYLPSLNSPIVLNGDGTLTNASVSGFRVTGEQVLNAMQGNNEISAFSVTVNPTQNVTSTGLLIVGVEIVPTATARSIRINIGYTLSI